MDTWWWIALGMVTLLALVAALVDGTGRLGPRRGRRGGGAAGGGDGGAGGGKAGHEGGAHDGGQGDGGGAGDLDDDGAA